MSDNEETTKPFLVERAKTGRANCKKCKQKCDVGVLRMAKVGPSPFGSGTLNNWYHIDCIFESFKTQRASTKTIETVDDISGWQTIGDLDKESLLEKLEKLPSFNKVHSTNTTSTAGSHQNDDDTRMKYHEKQYRENSKDNTFREFRKICCSLAEESSYLGKSSILHKFLLKGCNGERFEGKLFIWIKMLLPSADKRVYNLQSKQLIKLFARLFGEDPSDMLTHLEKGDVADTISEYFDKSDKLKPAGKSRLTLEQVDVFLDELAKLTKEDEQSYHFRKICKECTARDLEMIIRLIKHDIRINSGPKHILEALSKDAYPAYQSSQNLCYVVAKYGDSIRDNKLDSKGVPKIKKDTVGVQLMSPISPMLADACKSVEKAIEKCPEGMYSEIKYDGERVQLHKKGNEFRFFSRNLKPVQEHKIKACQEFIPQAFPNANDLILDSEIIAVDTTTGELLPFGTLGKHKKTEHETAEVCLFIFDCIYYNGNDLTKKTMKERRKILEDNICPIKNHVQLSEYHVIRNTNELSVMIAKVLQMGLEGLVLKNVNGIYEPGKRHWLKVKKDYLFDGKMADSADLVVLGAWFGTGKKGGMLSIFLMGCYDGNVWKTVTKVHTGLDDKTLNKMQLILKPLMKRADPDCPPKWIVCNKPMIPDMLAIDPTKMPVWEITGAEFSKSNIHTANGISIRFPRITKQRDDKSFKEATSLSELRNLFDASKQCTNLQLLTDGLDDADIDIKTKLQGGGDGSSISPRKVIVAATSSPSPEVKMKPAQKRDRSEDKSSTGSKKIKLKEVTPPTTISKPVKTNDDDDSYQNKSQKKEKRKFLFNDSSSSSSSNEDEISDKTKKMVNDAKSHAKIKCEEKQIITKASCISSTTKTRNTKTDNDDAIAGVPKNNEIKEQQQQIVNVLDGNVNADGDVTAAKNSYINIFENVFLHVPDNELRDCLKEELRYFHLWGGTELKNTNECTHVLHKNITIPNETCHSIRQKYTPRCRHVQYKWLVDSIVKRNLVDVINYPVFMPTQP